MCGRYYIQEDETSEQLRRIIAEAELNSQLPEGMAMKRGEVFPTDIVPIITQGSYRLMKWGYAGFASSSQRIINARSETIRDKAMFRSSLCAGRCLIPASHYYEWQRVDEAGKKKRKYAIGTLGEPIFMAGLWREEPDSLLPVFVILTRAASEKVAAIHHRMPVILPRQARHAWVGKGYDNDTEEILRQAIGAVEYRAV